MIASNEQEITVICRTDFGYRVKRVFAFNYPVTFHTELKCIFRGGIDFVLNCDLCRNSESYRNVFVRPSPCPG